LRTGAPIVPVAMVGAHELVGRRRIVLGLLRSLIRRPKVAVKVGEPIDVRALIGSVDKPSPRAIREAADHVMAALVALVAELRGESPEHPSGVPAKVLASS
jgi:1-acyl-sn-glycerol-3-phosphate acyltransferase